MVVPSQSPNMPRVARLESELIEATYCARDSLVDRRSAEGFGVRFGVRGAGMRDWMRGCGWQVQQGTQKGFDAISES